MKRQVLQPDCMIKMFSAMTSTTYIGVGPITNVATLQLQLMCIVHPAGF